MEGTPESPNKTDEELLQIARDAPEGDLRAFERLVEIYQKRILANCQYLTGDPNNAEDLAQEVFVKAFFAKENFEGRSSFRYWLKRIKVHHCLNHRKKTEGKEALAIDEEMSETHEQLQVSPDALQSLESIEERRRVDKVLQSMPTTLRIPLILRDMDELSYEEIAAELSIGLSAVKMRIKRARDLFRRLYQEQVGEPADNAQR